MVNFKDELKIGFQSSPVRCGGDVGELESSLQPSTSKDSVSPKHGVKTKHHTKKEMTPSKTTSSPSNRAGASTISSNDGEDNKNNTKKKEHHHHTASSSKHGSTITVAHTTHRRRLTKDTVQQSLNRRASSLTLMEFNFLNNLIQGNDTIHPSHLEAVQKVLDDSTLFFDLPDSTYYMDDDEKVLLVPIQNKKNDIDPTTETTNLDHIGRPEPIESNIKEHTTSSWKRDYYSPIAKQKESRNDDDILLKHKHHHVESLVSDVLNDFDRNSALHHKVQLSSPERKGKKSTKDSTSSPLRNVSKVPSPPRVTNSSFRTKSTGDALPRSITTTSNSRTPAPSVGALNGSQAVPLKRSISSKALAFHERRRASTIHASLWAAHERGISTACATTVNKSKWAVLRRAAQGTSIVSAMQPPPPNKNATDLSTKMVVVTNESEKESPQKRHAAVLGSSSTTLRRSPQRSKKLFGSNNKPSLLHLAQVEHTLSSCSSTDGSSKKDHISSTAASPSKKSAVVAPSATTTLSTPTRNGSTSQDGSTSFPSVVVQTTESPPSYGSTSSSTTKIPLHRKLSPLVEANFHPTDIAKGTIEETSPTDSTNSFFFGSSGDLEEATVEDSKNVENMTSSSSTSDSGGGDAAVATATGSTTQKEENDAVAASPPPKREQNIARLRSSSLSRIISHGGTTNSVPNLQAFSSLSSEGAFGGMTYHTTTSVGTPSRSHVHMDRRDSILDIVDERSVAAAALPVVLRRSHSFGPEGLNTPSQLRRMSSLNLHRAHSIHSTSSMGNHSFGDSQSLGGGDVTMSLTSPTNVTNLIEYATTYSMQRIPSLHRAHPLRSSHSVFMSDSQSIHSIHRAHPLRSSQSILLSESNLSGMFSLGSPVASMDDLDLDTSFRFMNLVHQEQQQQQQQNGTSPVAAVATTMASSPPFRETRGGGMFVRSSAAVGAAAPVLPLGATTRRASGILRQPSLGRHASTTAGGRPGATSFQRTVSFTRGDSRLFNNNETTAGVVDDAGVEAGEGAAAVVRPSPCPPALFTRQASINVYGGEGFEVMDPLATHLRQSESCISNITSVDDDEHPVVEGADDDEEGSANGSTSPDRMGIVARSHHHVASPRRLSSGITVHSSNVWRPTTTTNNSNDTSTYRRNMVLEDSPESPTMSKDTSTSKVNHDAGWEVDYAMPLVPSLPFYILGTSANDESAKPHVMSPPLMESLQNFLPESVYESNFWLRYSMVRDGADLITLLQNVRGSKHTFVAIETVDGEVFGSFTSSPWHKSHSYYGSGESFLWRMSGNRYELCTSVLDQAQLESDIEVFNWTGQNNMIQVCNTDRIGLGGGTLDDGSTTVGRMAHGDDNHNNDGFGLIINEDMIYGSSSPCATYGNPSLSKEGTTFEISNIEVWSLTPCFTVTDAERLEMSMLFLRQHSTE